MIASLMPPARKMLGLAWAAVLVLGIVPAMVRLAHTDVSWAFYLAERMMAGERQGSDFIEVNPPLFLFLALPPVLIERWAGIGAWYTHILLCCALAFVALTLTRRILGFLVPESHTRETLLLAIGFAAFMLPGTEFGQREHIAFVATLPYVVLAAGRLRGQEFPRGTTILVGLLAGAGFALKPHFLIAWLLIEGLLCVCLRRAMLRLEFLSLVIFGAAYLVAVLALVPAYIPMVVRVGPWYDRYINNGLYGAIVLADPIALIALAVVFVQVRANCNRDVLTSVLSLALIGFLAGALLQRKGFIYHYLAASCFGFVAMVRGWQVLPELSLRRPVLLLAQAGVLAVATITIQRTVTAVQQFSDPVERRVGRNRDTAELLPVVRLLAQGKPIAVLSSNPAAGWPLTRDSGATWALRYMSLWALPAIYDTQVWSSPDIVRPTAYGQRTGFEKQFSDEMVADLVKSRPRLVIVLKPDVAVHGWGGAQRFDYLQYFSSDPRFAAFMSDYDYLRDVGRYKIWKRVRELES